ncbi:MAG: hypothetical protein ACXWIA_11275 [Candidatus Aminicenantales bacterium]
MRTPRVVMAAGMSLFGLALLARPQDSHYWTNQYGSRATLLGGAVIGSVLDLSGTYYNPGGMSLVEKPHTLMAANVFQYPRVLLARTVPGSIPLNRFSPGPAPVLLAGTVRIRGLSKHWFGYSYLARQSVKLGISSSAAGVRDVLPDLPGPEDYVTQYRLDEKLSESWFGLTWSYKLSKHMGIGVTQYIVHRSQRAITQELVEARSSQNRLAVAIGERQYSYYHFRALWKIGLACDFETITLGFTLTSPSLAIGGSGSTGVNSTSAGLDLNGDGISEDFLASDYRRPLPVTYESPFSLAAGLTFKIHKVRLYWSAEWFARVLPYTVVKAGPFVAQSTGEILSTDVTQELSAVLNWGAGFEWFYAPRFKGYASFTTDDSAKKPGTSTNISLTDWDIHHIVTGGEFFIKKTSVTVGVGFSFGGREVGERPDIIARGGLEGIWDPFKSLKFRYNCYKLIVGFAI